MRRMFWGVLAVATLSVAAAFGQSGFGQDQPSLGDIARANREKQQEQEASGVTPKVITNKDLPAREPVGIPEVNPGDPMTQVSGVARPFRDWRYASSGNDNDGQPFGRPQGQGFSGQGFSGQGSGPRDGGNLRSRIQEQESRIAELQSRIDRASAMMHPNSTAQYEGPSNRAQAMQAQRIETMRDMLEQQKQRLAAMQEAARREGAHTNVYDP
jgi:hypothetical protein